MHGFAGELIGTCFLILTMFWSFTSFFADRSIEKFKGQNQFPLIMLIGLALFFVVAHSFSVESLWRYTLMLGVAADILVFMGLVVTLWSRAVLGKNWSSNVALKQNHTMITNGPYAYARHPIYTGALLMGSGIVIFIGSLGILITFIVATATLVVKSLQEERMLAKRFPAKYQSYKKRVKFLVPFVL